MFITDESSIMKSALHWKEGEVILLKAPTGAGKTTFVKDVLINQAIIRQKGLLFLVNRSTLVASITNELRDMFFSCRMNVPIPIVICTYQELEIKMQQGIGLQFLSNFYYVIADECHYFLNDAVFNPNTMYSYEAIVKTMWNHVTIFISATPDKFQEYLRRDINLAVMQNKIYYRYYNFDNLQRGNYTYFYANELEEIISVMKNSQEKFLVFVPSIKEGERIQKELDEAVPFLTSDVRQENVGSNFEIWQELIEYKKFSSRILIATAFIDNGISIHDEELHNIVILVSDPNAFLQMRGRKRCSECELVNVYLLARKGSYYNSKKKYYLDVIQKATQFYYSNINQRFYSIWRDEEMYNAVHKFCVAQIFNNVVHYTISKLSIFQLFNQYENYKELLEVHRNVGAVGVLKYQLQKWTGFMGEIYKIECNKEHERNAVKEIIVPIVGMSMSLNQFHTYMNPHKEVLGACYQFPNRFESSDNVSVKYIKNMFAEMQLPFRVDVSKNEDRRNVYTIVSAIEMVQKVEI